MAGVHVVTDGSAALPRDADLTFGISILPLVVALGDERWQVGRDLAADELFARLGASGTPASTHAAPPEAYLEAYQRILDWGVEVVSLHPPSHLNDSAGAARAALAMLDPGAPVSILETPWLASALGLLVIRAAQAGAEGASRAEIVQLVEDLAPTVHLWFAAADLGEARPRSALHQASPEGQPTADATVIGEFRSGTIRLLARVPTTIDALRGLIDLVAAEVDDERPSHFGVISAQADAEAAALATFLESRHLPVEMWLAPCDPCTATLAGSRLFGVATYGG